MRRFHAPDIASRAEEVRFKMLKSRDYMTLKTISVILDEPTKASEPVAQPTKVGFVSLGCPKNLVDSEVMMGMLVEAGAERSEEHTSELQSHSDLVCRLLL